MIAPRDSRWIVHLDGHRTTASLAAPWPDRLLLALGAQPAFVESLLGDLAEERADRAEKTGVVTARWWYIGQLLRSVPHLAWNAIRNGSPIARVRVAGLLAIVGLLAASALATFLLRAGPPARLVVARVGGGGTSDGVVINSTRPVQLEMRVLDARGRALASKRVRYAWLSGVPLGVGPTGRVTCAMPGDATVRASIDAIAATIVVRCRPVREVRAEPWISLIVGDPAQELAFEALGPDHRPVSLATGELRVLDSSIATLVAGRIRPLAAGQTEVTMRVGDGRSGTWVRVFHRVGSFEHLRAEQDFVATPVRLERGDSREWRLPKGPIWLEYIPGRDARMTPTITLGGPVLCVPLPASHRAVQQLNCVARANTASIRLTHPGSSTATIDGALALERKH